MYSYINNKYNRLLYFLLGFYIILIFVFSLLFNGFFVNSKAYQGDFPTITIRGTSDYNGSLGIVDWTFLQKNNNTRSIFYIPNPGNEDSNIYLLYKNGRIDRNRVIINNNGIGWYDDSVISGLNGTDYYNNLFNTNINNIVGYTIVMRGSNSDYGWKLGFDGDSLDSLQYVTNTEDLTKFFNDNDNSVVNIGNPLAPEENVDSQIPTPQKVAVYKDSTSPSLVWSNPKGIANNENIKVRIEWKPVITLTHGLYDVHSIIEQDYELLYYDTINNYNSFCTLNNNGSPPPNVLNSYNTIYDSKVLFSGTGAQQSNDWANYFIIKNNVDWVSRVDPFGTNDLFGKGTYSGVRVPDLKYRIRYETESGVSDWIYSDREFDTDNVSGPSQHSSTHSRNASGDPVSNPTYTPNNDNKIIPQNEVDDQENPDKKKSNSIFDFISGFFDTIISAISSIFEKLKELVDSISNGTGSFFSFFADLFGAFPQLLGIFLLGLVVTVLLRVLGR